ncbi:hypothetical protein LXL04_003019 [Taraxacum kok-saghyz]
MDEVDLNVLADGFGTEVGGDRDCNRRFFPRLTSSQRELFGSGPFGQFLNIPILNGDPLIIHAMMLQEECDIGVGQRGRFRFNVQGLHLEYGDSEFCLITGLKFGPFANLLAGTKNPIGVSWSPSLSYHTC